ncbi:sigma-E factor negative regulatory protein [Bowmanella dokdonensis]|uniref:Anti-sigma-E factor RseA n=1 Tax=Bowmanella dokdonensis TaxID=751969 RepID=A0A939ISS4_9ALTE|nr:RseA family anti-sigma factor [Bowmanella dokdonensis]MBN7827489.1 transcriptional regulator [Bowmanella dokdonensis]
MTQQKKESLSALMDGEESANGLFSDIGQDQGLQQTWRNYHLIRDGLRKELPSSLNFDISARVAAAIEQEPAILAPKKRLRDIPVVGQVIPLVRQGGQFAIAASVAAAMIIGVQQLNQPTPEQPFSSAPALQIPGMQAGGLSPVSLEQTRSLPPAADALEQKRRINAYLTDHQRQMRLKAQQAKESELQESEVEPQQK